MMTITKPDEIAPSALPEAGNATESELPKTNVDQSPVESNKPESALNAQEIIKESEPKESKLESKQLETKPNLTQETNSNLSETTSTPAKVKPTKAKSDVPEGTKVKSEVTDEASLKLKDPTKADTDKPKAESTSESAEPKAKPTSEPTTKSAKENPKHYRSYTEEEKVRFFSLIDTEDITIRLAAVRLGIPPGTCYYWYRKRSRSIQKSPQPTRRAVLELDDQQLDFLRDFIDAGEPNMSLNQILRALYQAYPHLEFPKMATQNLVLDRYRIFIKQANPWNSSKTDTTRAREDEVWTGFLKDPDVKFDQNCVFFDESYFHFNPNRRFVWTEDGSPSSRSPMKRAYLTSFFLVLSASGLVQIKLKIPTVALTLGGDQTTVSPYMNFVANVLEEIPKGHYLIMNHVPVRLIKPMRKLVEDSGYKAVFMPSECPQQEIFAKFWPCWLKNLRREAMSGNDTFTTRANEAAEKIPLEFLKKICTKEKA